jgi:phosphoribosyl 1,2-cyclic phosphodiesterase
MLNFCSLYSGSSGNSLFVETTNTRLLIDAGVSSKKIENALLDIDIDPSTIDGILITHEHIDHVQGLGTFSKKFNLPVFVNQETLDAMPKQRDKIDSNNIKTFKVTDKFFIGDLEVKPFSIPHDAANPCGFNIWKEDKKISIATDIGHMTNDILKNLEESLFIMLEANYDPEVLRCSSYPFTLKSRIAGPSGHLSNEIAGKTISYLLKSGLKNAMLGHLSKESNFPELAYQTVLDELITNQDFDKSHLGLNVASRDNRSKLINI